MNQVHPDTMYVQLPKKVIKKKSTNSKAGWILILVQAMAVTLAILVVTQLVTTTVLSYNIFEKYNEISDKIKTLTATESLLAEKQDNLMKKILNAVQPENAGDLPIINF